MRIIVADYSYGKLVERLITRPDAVVLTVESGDAALAACASEPPDLLLTRAIFPSGLNGFELARAILNENPGIRVVVFSPYHERFLAETLGQAPAGVVLLPRWTVPQMLDTIRSLLA